MADTAGIPAVMQHPGMDGGSGTTGSFKCRGKAQEDLAPGGAARLAILKVMRAVVSLAEVRADLAAIRAVKGRISTAVAGTGAPLEIESFHACRVCPGCHKMPEMGRDSPSFSGK
jgi:hypothetical protein